MANKPPHIYIDSCCFIDAVKHEAKILPPGKEAEVWYTKKLLEAHRAGEIVVITSILTVGECVAVESGQAKVPQPIQDSFRSLLTSGQYVHLAMQTPKTADLIQKFRWEHELVLGSSDAIHFATALEQSCVEFLTGDNRLKASKTKAAAAKLSSLKLHMIVPSGTGNLPDHYKQGTIAGA